MKFEMAIENLTQRDMDSLLVHLAVTNEENQTIDLFKKMAPLLGGQSETASFELNTKDLSGHQDYWFEINPQLEQPERHTFNNIAINQFYVSGDKRNPLLDVTFDGVKILNEDIVSPSPQIVISIEDENLFLPLDDTSYFKVFIQHPDTNALTYIPFDGEVFGIFFDAFYPATFKLAPGTQEAANIDICKSKCSDDESCAAFNYIASSSPSCELIDKTELFAKHTKYLYGKCPTDIQVTSGVKHVKN